VAGRFTVTEQEREVSPVDLAEALDWAVRAGLRLRSSDGDETWLEADCPVCAATLTTVGQPWNPVLAARRLEVFISRHQDPAGRHRTGEEEW
jgi:hypothetical protein